MPDYQNLGIGTKFIEAIGDYYLEQGLKYYYRSTHLRLGNFWENSPYWVATSHNKKKGDLNSNFSNENYHNERVCYSYEYMGKSYINEHINIHIDYSDKIDLKLVECDLKLLKDLGYYITVITSDVKNDNPIDLICKKLGIRTQLLYYRGKISGTYKNEKIITEWNKEFSQAVRDYYRKDN